MLDFSSIIFFLGTDLQLDPLENLTDLRVSADDLKELIGDNLVGLVDVDIESLFEFIPL